MSIELKSPTEAHYTVYKLTDPYGKIYIGCTGQTVERRWSGGRGYNNRTPVRSAINEFGWEKFKKEILCEKLTRAGGEKLEKWFIAYFESADPEKGYNRFLGGLGKGVHMSEATKQTCREVKNRQYEEHPELIEKIRDGVNAAYENDPVYRERISKGVRAAYERDPAIKMRIGNTVRQLWQDENYRRRATEGRIAFLIKNPELSAEMQRKRKQFYQEHPERRRLISEQMSRYLLSPQGRKFVEADGRPKPVRCVETGEEYPSQRAAEKATGFTGIHKACSGLQTVSGGYHWVYIELPAAEYIWRKTQKILQAPGGVCRNKNN